MSIIDLSGKWSLGECRTVLCLGNFDGVHLGHRALIERAKSRVASLKKGDENILCGVLSFSEPTQMYLSKDPPPRITDMSEKAEIFRSLGVDVLIALDFAEVRNMSPEDFVRRIMLDECGGIWAVCGFNYRFGARGAGDHKLLSRLMGGNADVVEQVEYCGVTVSSTAIRHAVERGDMEMADGMLGRPFCIDGEVRHGRAVGTGLGFATINQTFREGFLIPAHGVYITSCEIDGKIYPAISNVGTHPTFGDGSSVVCETHLLDFSGDLYGKQVHTVFHRFLRPEMKFDDPQELVVAVRDNIATAKAYFGMI